MTTPTPNSSCPECGEEIEDYNIEIPGMCDSCQEHTEYDHE